MHAVRNLSLSLISRFSCAWMCLLWCESGCIALANVGCRVLCVILFLSSSSPSFPTPVFLAMYQNFLEEREREAKTPQYYVYVLFNMNHELNGRPYIVCHVCIQYIFVYFHHLPALNPFSRWVSKQSVCVSLCWREIERRKLTV